MNTTFRNLQIGAKFVFARVLPGDVGTTYVKHGKISAIAIRPSGNKSEPFRVYAATNVVEQ